MDRITFRCPHCSKALAIDVRHAGKQVACPGCSARLTIPGDSVTASSSPETASPETASQTQPNEQPNEQVVQRNPFATESPQSTPTAPSPSPYSTVTPPITSEISGGGAATQASTSPNTSIGKSIAGLLVAMLVAGVCSAIWLLVVLFSGYELGILAWGIGGAVGLVAGLIGRNPSPVYCGIAAAIAIMSVLAAKGIMVAGLMAMSWSAQFAMDLADLSPEQEKFRVVMADQMLANGDFQAMEKQYAEAYVAAYFSGGSVYDVMTDEMHEVADQVDDKIQAQLKLLSSPEQEQLLVAARQRHPEWIEEHNHYLAIVDQMRDEEATLTADLAAHAKYELAVLDNAWDDEYHESVSADELATRRLELRTLAAERINSTDEPQLDQAVRTTLQRHHRWNPYPDAYNALLEKMHGEGVFTGPLAEHAKATIDYELTDDYPDYFETISEDDLESRDEQLRTAVNERLVSLDTAARAAMIAETKSRYPDWHGQEMTPEEMQQDLAEAFEEIGTDGTLLGNFLAVFSFMDLLWFFLGATTAFGTARKYGMSE
ncbi:MAG TPA: hypothetical protein VMM76_19755 [Pirellulaceae bacterium]|nr:hypothetical protein [Pirellulaceae bacterium]